MALNLVDLDELTRTEMQAEVAGDVATRELYLSPRLSEIGRREYPHLLQEAVVRHDEAWLAAQLRSGGRLNTRELSHSKTGKVIDKLVPITAADTLAEGEFNRFYLRGLCRRAIAAGMAESRSTEPRRWRTRARSRLRSSDGGSACLPSWATCGSVSGWTRLSACRLGRIQV